ncbi:MAG: hypothetical protein JWR15_824, partial [Prosthecobacter sp.]|nr:hypothetical protein [Prosthecobacter sp.]
MNFFPRLFLSLTFLLAIRAEAGEETKAIPMDQLGAEA